MRLGLLSLMLVGLISCTTKKTSPATETDSSTEIPFAKTFDDCFTPPDASYEQVVAGCTQGFYKVLNEQLVLRISPDLDLQHGECKEWKLAADDPPSGVELILFNRGEASLITFCAGIVPSEVPYPINRMNKAVGTIRVGKQVDDQEQTKTTIYVEQLVFFDPDTYEEIVIRDELFWEVPDRGMPE
jgi:hypothetical protein